MDQKVLLMELDEAFDRLSCGLNAFKLMALGLEEAQDPYADGLYAIWRYLDGTGEEIQNLLDAVSAGRATA